MDPEQFLARFLAAFDREMSVQSMEEVRRLEKQADDLNAFGFADRELCVLIEPGKPEQIIPKIFAEPRE